MWELTWPELPFGPLWVTLGPFSSLPSRLFSDLCVFWQAIRVEWSSKRRLSWEARRAPPLDQRVLDQRTPTLGGSSVPWIPWNMEELPRPWGEHGKEKKDPTYRRGKRYLRQKITSLLWLHTDGHKHACTPLPTGYNLYVLWALIQEGKALARYPCVHVRKSEFPGMLF